MCGKRKKGNNGRFIASLCVIVLLLLGTYYYAVCSDDTSVQASEGIGSLNGFGESAVTPSERFFPDATSTELPYFGSDAFVIRSDEGRYTLLYDTMYRQAAWVAYVLTGDDVNAKGVKRKDRFVPDPQVVACGYPTARTSDYTGSGYDRGHLCPSADRSGNRSANDCTFMLSNISPQRPALNRGVWKSLEEQVRRWAVKYDTLYVVTGGVLKSGLKRISGGVGVPEYFYKAVLTHCGGDYHAVAFIIPNDVSYSCGWKEYAVSVDSVERVTELDFFHNLPDDVENRVESGDSFGFWF